MRNFARSAAVSLIAGAALTAGGLAPAQASPVITGGVVNITVTDVLNGTTVVVQRINVGIAAALGLAANVCDVHVGVLAQQLHTGSATCTNTVTGQTATIRQIA